MRGGFCRTVTVLSAVAMIGGGCSSTYPTDLALHSVEFVNEINEREIEGMSPLRYNRRSFLEVNFTTAIDLVEFRRDTSYSIGAQAYVCGADPESEFLNDRTVYWNGFNLVWDQAIRAIGSKNTVNNNELNQYYFYIYADDAAKQKFRFPPTSICFYIRGGTMVGSTYRSNEVVIPEAAISEALRGMPPG